MTFLSLDLGIAKIGWVLAEKKSNKLKIVKYGILETSSKTNIAKRIQQIYQSLRTIIRKFKPKAIIFEKMYYHKFSPTLLSNSYVYGIVYLLSALYSLPTFQYNPKSVKLSTTGYGDADKYQVKEMLAKIYNLPFPIQTHITDALAIALCHFQSLKCKKLIS